MTDATEYLQAALAGGRRMARDLFYEAGSHGISFSALDDAVRALDIVEVWDDKRNVLYWQLGPHVPSPSCWRRGAQCTGTAPLMTIEHPLCGTALWCATCIGNEITEYKEQLTQLRKKLNEQSEA